MIKRTPLYAAHLKAFAKMVDFAGWEMPLHYGSQLQEHHQVRQHAGMFDVSHMGIIDLEGSDAIPFLRFLLANNVDRLHPGKALYTCMLNNEGGVLDDLIVYKINDHFFRIVVNAGTRDKDLAWMKQQALSFKIDLKERKDLVMLALQGPEVIEKLTQFFSPEEVQTIKNLKPFNFISLNEDCFIARTGYTGEDGVELIIPETEADKYWQAFLELNIAPCGLGARDTLRLEAGLNLYGSDMDETVTPFEAGLTWTVALEPSERDFIGKQALIEQRNKGVEQCLVGLILEGPGIIRNHQAVLVDGQKVGEITSGGYSPTLEKSIALARVPANTNQSCFVEIRHKPILARIVKPPFVRHGKKLHE